MTNYKKYFGTPELAAETLEKIMYGQLNICDLMCNFSKCNKDINFNNNLDCVNDPLLDDYDCCDGIKYWLEKDEDKN